jgi:hypothetical protein
LLPSIGQPIPKLTGDEPAKVLAAFVGMQAYLSDGYSVEDISKRLIYLAAMLGAALPEQRAVAMQAEVLTEIPRDLFDIAFDKIIRSHKYPTMPTPGSFFEAIGEELEEAKGALLNFKLMFSRWDMTNKDKE